MGVKHMSAELTYFMVTVLSRIVEPSVASDIPPAAAPTAAPAAAAVAAPFPFEALDAPLPLVAALPLPFLLGKASDGTARSRKTKNEMTPAQLLLNTAMMKEKRPASANENKNQNNYRREKNLHQENNNDEIRKNSKRKKISAKLYQIHQPTI
jgi:hypothetical protein